MARAWVFIVVGAAVFVVACVWRFVYLKRLAEQHGLDTAELIARDLLGGYGAVHRVVADAAVANSEETKRQLDRERARRERAEQQTRDAEERRLLAEHAPTATTDGEIPIIPSRPVEARLAELGELAKQGLISPAEATARRGEILKEI
jgi:hypothetical protein